MKKLTIALCFAIAFAAPAWSQSCPHPNTQLSAGTNSKTLNSNGRQSVGNFSAELWADGNGTMTMTAYGDNGGGSAFKANWGNAGDFLARVGYYWGNGGKYTQYNNICADYNYVKTGNAGGYNYIGVYGWTKNPTVEYYIVDDWWGDNRGIADMEGSIKGGGSNFQKLGSFDVDGGTYNVYKNQRNNAPSINGTETFWQFFSVRTSRRTCGTISVTEHFKKWASYNMSMGNMYEASITVEAGGGTGSIDYRYGKMSQVTGSCGGSTSATSSSSSSKASSSSTTTAVQATTCPVSNLVTYGTVPANPYTACFKYSGTKSEYLNKCYVCKIDNEGDGNTCASSWLWNNVANVDDNLALGYWYKEVPCPSSNPSSSSKASSSSAAVASSSSRASSSSAAATASSSSRASSSSAAATASSSSRASSSSAAAAIASSSSVANSSSAAAIASSSSDATAGSDSSSSEDNTPILNSQFSTLNSNSTYYSIKGEPLGAAKPQKAGIYIVKQGSSVKKIVVR